ncbi:uncharacterized protein EDB91DRAFT_1249490 [Suillus paluster]|uniref:uncharacterized protein n=1 Tax=Suillus paluster TaxID=48578 RepID=UPI001B86433F|nr:uncharacterized protein EDB91DRAFT_1249490 [Suillus paluster]KAG1737816.1 hypothetical protein EDB91DRAFT_1249490 [Suillus paluster]
MQFFFFFFSESWSNVLIESVIADVLEKRREQQATPPTVSNNTREPEDHTQMEAEENYNALHLTAHYCDELQSNPIPIPVLPAPVEPDAPAANNLMNDDIQQRVDWVQTEHDAFELFCKYPHSFPTYDPKNLSYFDHLCDALTFSRIDGGVEHERPWWAGFGSSLEAVHRDYFAPFLNATTFRLMNWFYNASL